MKRLLVPVLLSLAFAGAAAAATYNIDARHTQVQFTYNHFGYSNLSGRLNQVSDFSQAAQVLSVLAPYECPRCGPARLALLDMTTPASRACVVQSTAPERHCSAAGSGCGSSRIRPTTSPISRAGPHRRPGQSSSISSGC